MRMKDEMLEVLKEIRDEAKQTNHRLESLEGRVETTNSRLESLEGRVQFVEKRLSAGFEGLTGRLDSYVERLDIITRRQTDSELRLASEVLSLADVTREVRDLLSNKLDDHQQVTEHEHRIRALEDRIADRTSE
ncbi:MAG TPA: hypothetical protein VHL58_04700 [Thermoanaerobaculia bacterium]|nr:hypothetical protein [Thermoanaerobaculia bacterium]